MAESLKKFNKNHPELMEGEVFLTNISDIEVVLDMESGRYNFTGGKVTQQDKLNGILKNFEMIGWRTKRLGNIGYDIYGNIYESGMPVFVQRSELEAAGIDPDNIFEGADLRAI